jgi:hypothetical protein
MAVSSFGLALRHAVRHFAVQIAQMADFNLRVPIDPLAAVAELFQQRPDRGEFPVQVGIVPFDRDVVRRGLAGDQVTFALLPVLHMGLRQFGGGVVEER